MAIGGRASGSLYPWSTSQYTINISKQVAGSGLDPLYKQYAEINN